MADKDLVMALADALSRCMDDLDAWASSGPEGFTKDEKRRFAEYQRTLEWANEWLTTGSGRDD